MYTTDITLGEGNEEPTRRCDERKGRIGFPSVVWLFTCLMIGMLSSATSAQDIKSYTRATFGQWLNKYANATADFKPGDVLTANDLERMRPFIPPGYLEQVNFPEFKAHIGVPFDHTPAQPYVGCTEKYQSQVRLKSNGTLDNYVCGQPFANSELNPGDPIAGLKAAYNWEFRWQNYGTIGHNLVWTWDRFGGTHVAPVPESPPTEWITLPLNTEKLPKDTSDLYRGGGTFQRSLQSNYQRTYFSHLAQVPSHVLPIPGAKDFEYKEIVTFFEPFDIRGTAFISYRYSDPFRADDAWAYVPQLRRVRRISAEVKSDSLLGTDHTIEDFYGFSGRTLEWNWKFLGWKDVLFISDPKYVYTHLYGPNGIIPDDDWTLRRVAILERTPRDPRHPYTSSILFCDPQNYQSGYTFAFDRKGKLWKVWEWQWKWTESYDKEWSEYNRGVRFSTFQSVQVLDVQNDRGTIILGFGFGYPEINADEVARVFDINRLEEAHR